MTMIKSMTINKRDDGFWLHVDLINGQSACYLIPTPTEGTIARDVLNAALLGDGR